MMMVVVVVVIMMMMMKEMKGLFGLRIKATHLSFIVITPHPSSLHFYLLFISEREINSIRVLD